MSVAGEVEGATAIAALKDTVPNDVIPNGHTHEPNHIDAKDVDATTTAQDEPATAINGKTADVTTDSKIVDAPATETLDAKDSEDTLVDAVADAPVGEPATPPHSSSEETALVVDESTVAVHEPVTVADELEQETLNDTQPHDAPSTLAEVVETAPAPAKEIEEPAPSAPVDIAEPKTEDAPEPPETAPETVNEEVPIIETIANAVQEALNEVKQESVPSLVSEVVEAAPVPSKDIEEPAPSEPANVVEPQTEDVPAHVETVPEAVEEKASIIETTPADVVTPSEKETPAATAGAIVEESTPVVDEHVEPVQVTAATAAVEPVEVVPPTETVPAVIATEELAPEAPSEENEVPAKPTTVDDLIILTSSNDQTCYPVDGNALLDEVAADPVISEVPVAVKKEDVVVETVPVVEESKPEEKVAEAIVKEEPPVVVHAEETPVKTEIVVPEPVVAPTAAVELVVDASEPEVSAPVVDEKPAEEKPVAVEEFDAVPAVEPFAEEPSVPTSAIAEPTSVAEAVNEIVVVEATPVVVASTPELVEPAASEPVSTPAEEEPAKQVEDVATVPVVEVPSVEELSTVPLIDKETVPEPEVVVAESPIVEDVAVAPVAVAEPESVVAAATVPDAPTPVVEEVSVEETLTDPAVEEPTPAVEQELLPAVEETVPDVEEITVTSVVEESSVASPAAPATVETPVEEAEAAAGFEAATETAETADDPKPEEAIVSHQEVKVDWIPVEEETDTAAAEGTPEIAITPDVSESTAEVTAQEPERPKSPWTPSYSVTTQGAGISDDAKELDELEKLPEVEPVTAVAPSVSELAVVAEAAPVVSVEVETIETPTVVVEEDVSEPIATEEAKPASSWPVSYSVSSQGSSPLHIAQVTDDADVATVEPLSQAAEVHVVETTAVSEEPVETAPEPAPEAPIADEPTTVDHVSEPAPAAENLAPAATAVPPQPVEEDTEPETEPEASEQPSIPELKVEDNTVILADVAPAPVEPVERPWTPSYSVTRQGSSPLHTPKELEEEEAVPEVPVERPWTPSYSVTRQGSSPLLATHQLEDETPVEPAPIVEEPQVIEDTAALAEPETPAVVVVDSEPSATPETAEEPAAGSTSETERPKSPFAASYSVTQQGSSPLGTPAVESKDLPVHEPTASDVTAVEEPTAKEVVTPEINTAAENVVEIAEPTPVHADGEETEVSESLAQPEKIERPWTPSYSVTRQGSVSPAPEKTAEEVTTTEAESSVPVPEKTVVSPAVEETSAESRPFPVTATGPQITTKYVFVSSVLCST
ncbi:hypothetical protein BXZ70DRAFT_206856 [Cristinia sonorae]|uniref:Zonadhesin n=1 Tax=Cristinia sonorae TaxID=1940300 RepID=A0A8K0UNV2_9AGAR|nr:hypothetical protein BXZ70DRAFT_206856 [Cristinia sonorae]